MSEFSFTVKYTYYPAYRGYRNSLFVPEEPDEPEDVDIESITDEYNNLIELSDRALDQIAEHILKHIQD